MFYSHQLLARKAPLGQIWMAATMQAKMNRRKLNKIKIISICEEILNPPVPMALRLSGILLGGVVIVYERKVKLLYDDVSRFLVEINEAWKVKPARDPTVLPKRKLQAKKEAVTLPDKQGADVGDIEHSLNSSNAAATMGFRNRAYLAMWLDSVDEPYYGPGEKDAFQHFHQAEVDDINLFQHFDSYQTNTDTFNHFERFVVEGDEDTQLNFTSGEHLEIPNTLIPSPTLHDDGGRGFSHHSIFQQELKANLMNNSLRKTEANLITPRNSSDEIRSIPSYGSGHGFPSHHSEVNSGRSNKKRPYSSSRHSGSSLKPVAEENDGQYPDPNFKLSRLSENGPTHDHELLVETGPTQTQLPVVSQPVDQITDSIRMQMKAHFETPEAPQVETLNKLAAGMNRKGTAMLFYQTCVLASHDILRVEQKVPYGKILISKGSKM